MQHHGNREMAQLVKCELQSQENQEWQWIPIIPASGKWRQEDSSSLWPGCWVKEVRKREGESEIEKNIQCRPLDFRLYSLNYLHTCVTCTHAHANTHTPSFKWISLIANYTLWWPGQEGLWAFLCRPLEKWGSESSCEELLKILDGTEMHRQLWHANSRQA